MHDAIQYLQSNPILAGAVKGLMVTAGNDLVQVLRLSGWSSVKAYNWSAATWHWVTGAILGAAAAGGWTALTGG